MYVSRQVPLFFPFVRWTTQVFRYDPLFVFRSRPSPPLHTHTYWPFYTYITFIHIHFIHIYGRYIHTSTHQLLCRVQHIILKKNLDIVFKNFSIPE